MRNKKQTAMLLAATSGTQATAPRPEFLRLPRTGTKCPITGLSRTGMFVLIKSGLVKSVVLRRREKGRGTRLVNYASLLDYLHGLEVEQIPNPPKERI